MLNKYDREIQVHLWMDVADQIKKIKRKIDLIFEIDKRIDRQID